jgi:hypothetical protein
MFRSPRHRLLLAAYAGVGFALVLNGLAALFARAPLDAARAPSAPLLSIPLVLSFFLISGVRYGFSVPVQLPANWALRLLGDDELRRSLAGVRIALAAAALGPLLAAMLPVYALLWGWKAAAMHTLFCAVLSLLLLEVSLLNFHKLPFTCSYQPGKLNLTLTALFFCVAFTTYAYTMASIERALLAWPAAFLVVCAAGLAGVVVLARWRAKLLARGRIIFDDEPDVVVRTLDIGSASVLRRPDPSASSRVPVAG